MSHYPENVRASLEEIDFNVEDSKGEMNEKQNTGIPSR